MVDIMDKVDKLSFKEKRELVQQFEDKLTFVQGIQDKLPIWQVAEYGLCQNMKNELLETLNQLRKPI